jgi:hypothetical protein
MIEPDFDKWLKWARDERERYKSMLERAEAGCFKISEMDGYGTWKDNTHQHIVAHKSAIASLNDLIGD